ncbi:hypothetical protein B0I33_103407 [Prauserella shujinwangii]|uniref:DUF3558 domain-containing protein n=1 Tax=Prauserella shujinwangii TaxID=1453103 RepID=A0A2T0LZ90_9PSEU|nr:hypothetical protein [Prauserella shujinwangii]PRX49372.1 hypothetical protein B0I33_103407 [Prauserella shujinwangii]
MGTGQQPNPGQWNPQYQQHYAQQYQQYQQGRQYPPHLDQQHYRQGAPPGAPKQKRGRKGGILIGVLATIVVLGLAFGGYWLWYLSDSDDPPPLDTSLDLADAPMGCGMFTENEISHLVPGTFTTEGGGGLSGDKDYAKDAQCMYSNLDTYRDEGQPAAHLSVTTRLHKADHPGAYRAQSGVDNAKEELRRKPGSAIGVPNANDDRFREIEGSSGGVAAAQLSILYRNVTVTFHYNHDGLDEGQFTQPLMRLAQLAILKIDPSAGGQQQPGGSAAPSLPVLPGG